MEVNENLNNNIAESDSLIIEQVSNLLNKTLINFRNL